MASAQSPNPQQKSLLLQSVARFLESNSFYKTLKKFLSEAQIQKNDLTGSSLDLEEMCCKYLAISDHSSSKSNREQFQDMSNGNLNNEKQEGVAPAVGIKKKKKKKRDSENTNNVIVGQNVVDDISAKPKMSEEQVSHETSMAPMDNIMGGLQQDESTKKKEKKKKKGKVDSELGVDKAECAGGKSEKSKDAVSVDSNRVSDAGIEKKTSKSKDKKKKKDNSGELEKGESERKESKDNKNGISKEDSTITDGKGSKKRKRLESEVHESLPIDENAAEESKRRKTESGEEQHTKLKHIVRADKHVTEANNGENVDFGVKYSQKKPSKHRHERENGNKEETGKNSEQKSSKKEQNSSVQSKKFFQRVNADEVVFVDKRLEDNSYWAKDGADTGYGAKAQEVLGQVRGRDFRHEKTKKKRGSYRGGQIDVQSHSIKFNYSDEE